MSPTIIVMARQPATTATTLRHMTEPFTEALGEIDRKVEPPAGTGKHDFRAEQSLYQREEQNYEHSAQLIPWILSRRCHENMRGAGIMGSTGGLKEPVGVLFHGLTGEPKNIYYGAFSATHFDPVV